jgi:hypothetical protein
VASTARGHRTIPPPSYTPAYQLLSSVSPGKFQDITTYQFTTASFQMSAKWSLNHHFLERQRRRHGQYRQESHNTILELIWRDVKIQIMAVAFMLNVSLRLRLILSATASDRDNVRSLQRRDITSSHSVLADVIITRMTLSVSTSSATPTLHILPSGELHTEFLTDRPRAVSATAERSVGSPHISVQIPRRWSTKANSDYRCSRFAKHDRSPLYRHEIFQRLTRHATYIKA